MIDTLRRNPLIAALALACAVLAGIVVFELLMGTGGPAASSVRKAAPAESKLLPPIAAIAPDQVYAETVNRPLWIPTRRPAPAAAVVPASFARGQFILQGVIVAGGTHIAMLREKASGRMHRVEKGRDVNGVTVAEIDPDKVTLAQGDEREVVELRVPRPGAPGTPGAPPASPPSAAVAGPFASTAAPTPPGAVPPTAAATPAPSAPPAGSPFGLPPRPPHASVGPLAPPTQQVSPTAPVTNPSAAPVPQQATTAPMTPEELLARRRARRNQSP